MSRQRTMEKILSSEYVTIGELVRLTDVRYSTLKYYTEEGMLPFEQSEANLTRRYRREESVKRKMCIRDRFMTDDFLWSADICRGQWLRWQ